MTLPCSPCQRCLIAILQAWTGLALLAGAAATEPGAAEPGAAGRGMTVPEACVSELRAGPGPGAGIPTGRLARDVEVRLCDGALAALAASDGGLELKDRPGDDRRPESRFDPGAGPAPEGAAGTPGVSPGAPGSAVSCARDPLYDAQPSVFRSAIFAVPFGPTEDYRHAILGDPVEASGFCTLNLWTGEAATLTLAPGSVFEDLRVRLVDLTGDGEAEFVLVRSHLVRGAALAVYRLVGGRIEPLAETPAIGIANRWLNPAGAADFDGDGRVEIAYVETPHIGGTLRVWGLAQGRLRQELAVEGFSNHAIGSRELDLSAVLDWNADGVPDLALPDAARRRLRVVTFAGGRFAELAAFPHDARIRTAILATDLDADGRPELLYGLEDGRLMMATP